MFFKSNSKRELKPLSEYDFDSNEKIIVSICVSTHNQKEYVTKCLESILSQFVNFRAEILINDDASTDGTLEILEQYKSKYPNIIEVYKEQENQFSKNYDYSYVYRVHSPRIKGKYVALIDSDDYYCDSMALYSKVLTLEKHTDCNACFSKVKKINNNNQSLIELMPRFRLTTKKLSSKKLIDMFIKSYCFQTSSYFFRAHHYTDFCDNYPLFAQKIKVFDEPVVMYFGSLGNTYFINKIFSVYRKYSTDSWSNVLQRKNKEQTIVNMENRINYLNEFNIYTKHNYEKSCRWGVCHAKICILNAKGDIYNIFQDKNLLHFYKKRYPKEYIKLKLKSKKKSNNDRQK